jgi:hypothetical protein
MKNHVQRQEKDFYKLIQKFDLKNLDLSKIQLIGIILDLMSHVNLKLKEIAELKKKYIEKQLAYHFLKSKIFTRIGEINIIIKLKNSKYYYFELDLAYNGKNIVVFEIDDDLKKFSGYKLKYLKKISDYQIKRKTKYLKKRLNDFDKNPHGIYKRNHSSKTNVKTTK